MNIPVPKWGPRLARLYTLDMRALEKRHAAAVSPGTTSWQEAVPALYKRMGAIGPRKGAKLLHQVGEYLSGVDVGERAHMLLAWGWRSRSAHLVFATFSIGNHPDPAVREDGLNIAMHLIECSRTRPRCATGIAVAFLSMHTLKRIFERSDFGNEDATTALAYVAVCGYLAHRDARHFGGGMNLLVETLLVTGAMHRFQRALPNGRVAPECVFDVRTVLERAGCSSERRPQLEQGSAAAAAVLQWLKDDPNLNEWTLAASIPPLPRRESYPARLQQDNS